MNNAANINKNWIIPLNNMVEYFIVIIWEKGLMSSSLSFVKINLKERAVISKKPVLIINMVKEKNINREEIIKEMLM